MKNRFNRLTSKEWLPFQKSWFRYTGDENLFRQNLRFFTHAEATGQPVFFYGRQEENLRRIAAEEQLEIITSTRTAATEIQFALLDLRDEVAALTAAGQWNSYKQNILSLIADLKPKIEQRRFLCILLPQLYLAGTFLPVAWDLAETVSGIFSLKDEKIAGLPGPGKHPDGKSFHFTTDQQIFYILYFRKDENSGARPIPTGNDFFKQNQQQQDKTGFGKPIPSWFILKPPPRRKNEILHPAKYPEDLTTMYIEQFTRPGENVFDPMSGTGSTQVAALKAGRNGYGTELSSFFAEIAGQRCRDVVQPENFPEKAPAGDYRILQKDARQILAGDFPPLHYIITSPPYWDMLNMKGAEYQATRKSKGLQLNYSEDDRDLGNITEYQAFIDQLKSVYFHLADLLQPGRYMTIVVKNIKKKGRNYPFAWDLGRLLQEKLILLPEAFWCQDDISIAPYGYGNTWVSNTFHQYCLTFQKPY